MDLIDSMCHLLGGKIYSNVLEKVPLCVTATTSIIFHVAVESEF